MRKYRSRLLGVELSAADLATLKGPELSTLYQELTGHVVRKFRDRATAIRRVTPLLERATPPEVVPARAPGQPRDLFSYPAKAEILPHRPGTKRATLVAMLSREGGATFDELRAATLWPYKILQENVRLLWSALGYGLQQDEVGGKIRLVRG